MKEELKKVFYQLSKKIAVSREESAAQIAECMLKIYEVVSDKNEKGNSENNK